MTAVMIVDPDQQVSDLIADALSRKGFSTAQADCLDDAKRGLEVFSPDVVLMELELPEMDGLLQIQSFVTDRRGLIVVSGRSTRTDKVLALRLGADDFIEKPVYLLELEARVDRVLRRVELSRPLAESRRTTIQVGDLMISTKSGEVRVGDKRVNLTPTEMRLLATLASEPGRTIARSEIAQRVWGYDGAEAWHSIDVHVGRMRAKLLGAGLKQCHLQTVRGAGFCLMAAQ